MSSQACYPDKAPKVDELLDILSHHLRREVIQYFEAHTDNETATFDDVVTHIEQRVPAETSETLYVKLIHKHLPRLAECGLLDYDTRSENIRYHGHDRARRWLREIRAVF